MNIAKNQRAVIIVSNLSDLVYPEWKPVYQWLESNAVNLDKGALYPHYQYKSVLAGNNCTWQNLVSRLNYYSKKPQVKAIDLFLHTHGGKNQIGFKEGNSISTGNLKNKIKTGVANRSKLRMVYSTACFGYSHADDFVAAGFKCASGSEAINTNGPIELPTFLATWILGQTFKACIQATQDPISSAATAASDALISSTFSPVNSHKKIKGAGHKVSINQLP